MSGKVTNSCKTECLLLIFGNRIVFETNTLKFTTTICCCYYLFAINLICLDDGYLYVKQWIILWCGVLGNVLQYIFIIIKHSICFAFYVFILTVELLRYLKKIISLCSPKLKMPYEWNSSESMSRVVLKSTIDILSPNIPLNTQVWVLDNLHKIVSYLNFTYYLYKRNRFILKNPKIWTTQISYKFIGPQHKF